MFFTDHSGMAVINVAQELLRIISALPENEIQDVGFVETSIGDVLLTLTETYGAHTEQVDAKRLSDGTLRCLAVAAAVLVEKAGSVIVIEEIDNGIHAGRIQRLIE